MARNAASAKAVTTTAANERDDDEQLISFRLPKRKVKLIQMIMARDEITQVAYFDRLVSEDILREQASIAEQYELQRQRAEEDAAAFARDKDSFAVTTPRRKSRM